MFQFIKFKYKKSKLRFKLMSFFEEHSVSCWRKSLLNKLITNRNVSLNTTQSFYSCWRKSLLKIDH